MVLSETFAERFAFPLDDFQLRAMDAIDAGRSVLVAAPTGAGKTVIAEFAAERALAADGKAFYTTPLKALSNQKYGDFVRTYGPGAVGLLTGDNTINSEASVVVMTTEVLRNMLYERSSTLDRLMSVVMDEVHYLQDPYRGAVWEEVLIHLPRSVSVVCLSATISNAEEFGEWIGTLRGDTDVIIEEKRPVPIEHHYMVGPKLHAMHVEQDGVLMPNPYVVSLEQETAKTRTIARASDRGGSRRGGGRNAGRGYDRAYVPRREDVVETLAAEGMLPAIYFVFSRAGCQRSVDWLRKSGVRLTTKAEAEKIREVAESRAAWMGDEDLATLGFFEFLEALERGIAAHHAGMLPIFKETVEELFAEGLVKVVFATETLSLGINMPARTVVIEDLWKFSGERHEILTPGEYTQLTGRAGRRGIDPVGHAVVLYQKQVQFERVAGLAATRTYNLVSSFRPSYNMAVNLVRNYTQEQSHRLLNSSFAQFLADRGVVALESSMSQDRDALEGYRANMVCHLGDFAEYWALLEKARRLRDVDRKERATAQEGSVKDALAKLRPGDVIHVPRTPRRGLAVVVSSRDGKPMMISHDRTFFRLTVRDLDAPPTLLTRVQLPRHGSARSPRYRRDVAAQLVALDVKPVKAPKVQAHPKVEHEAAKLEARAAGHPCRSCPDLAKHERWAGRAEQIERRLSGVEKRIRVRTETLARQFDRVLGVLSDLGCIRDWTVTEKGRALTKIYGEADILVSEALDSGLFEGLTPPEAAALVSSLVFESREREPVPGFMPTRLTMERFELLERLWRRVRRAEDAHQVQLCRELDAGLAAIIYRWAQDSPLEEILQMTEMAPGDFVRNCKQLIDLLRQIEEVAPPQTAALMAEARASVLHGVVAYTGVGV